LRCAAGSADGKSGRKRNRNYDVPSTGHFLLPLPRLGKAHRTMHDFLCDSRNCTTMLRLLRSCRFGN
jgi:hypothetical protein